jgi:hypothetical protein
MQKEESDGKSLAAYWQNDDLGDAPLHFHRCNLHAQANLSAITLMTFETPSFYQPSPRRCVAMKVRLRVARRHAHTVHLRRNAEEGRTRGDEVLEGGYEEGEDVR